MQCWRGDQLWRTVSVRGNSLVDFRIRVVEIEIDVDHALSMAVSNVRSITRCTYHVASFVGAPFVLVPLLPLDAGSGHSGEFRTCGHRDVGI